MKDKIASFYAEKVLLPVIINSQNAQAKYTNPSFSFAIDDRGVAILAGILMIIAGLLWMFLDRTFFYMRIKSIRAKIVGIDKIEAPIEGKAQTLFAYVYEYKYRGETYKSPGEYYEERDKKKLGKTSVIEINPEDPSCVREIIWKPYPLDIALIIIGILWTIACIFGWQV